MTEPLVHPGCDVCGEQGVVPGVMFGRPGEQIRCPLLPRLSEPEGEPRRAAAGGASGLSLADMLAGADADPQQVNAFAAWIDHRISSLQASRDGLEGGTPGDHLTDAVVKQALRVLTPPVPTRSYHGEEVARVFRGHSGYAKWAVMLLACRDEETDEITLGLAETTSKIPNLGSCWAKFHGWDDMGEETRLALLRTWASASADDRTRASLAVVRNYVYAAG